MSEESDTEMDVEIQNKEIDVEELSRQIESLRKMVDTLTKKNENAQIPRQINNPPMILKTDTNFETWKKQTIGELKALGYEDTLAENTENIDSTRINYVNSHILARLDKAYKQLVYDLEEPFLILEKLDRLRNPILFSNKITLERQWSSLNMTEKEAVLDFTNSFQTLTKKLIRMDVNLEPSKIAGNYAIAVMGVYPEVSKMYPSRKGKINLDDLVEIALNLESTEKEKKERFNEGSNIVEVNITEEKIFKKPEQYKITNRRKEMGSSCYRCGRPGHRFFQCRSRNKICYNCGKRGIHESKDCTARRPSKFSSFRSERNSRRRGRGGSRFSMRGGRGIKRGRQQRQYDRPELYKKVKFLGVDGKEKLALMAVRSNNNDISGNKLNKNNKFQEFCLKVDLINNTNINNYNNYDCITLKDFTISETTPGVKKNDIENFICSSKELFVFGEKEKSGSKSSDEKIKFIGDSGATEHIVQNEVYLIMLKRL
ncbi:hypothetical protein PGB90_000939 [Kerria lacca]